MLTPMVRSTTIADREVVVELVRRAFTSAVRDGREEVDIVKWTWTLAPPRDTIDLVAVMSHVTVGHVLAAPGDVDGVAVPGVAPLSVSPPHQRRGIGCALMVELLRRAEEAGWPAAVVLGDPAYYRRFGFEPAWPLGVVYPPAGSRSPHFQFHRLGHHRPFLHGIFRYVWEADEKARAKATRDGGPRAPRSCP